MMKYLSSQLTLAAACAALTLAGPTAPALAAEQDRGGPADRIERLERRLNEMAQRQEQFMRRMGAQQERQAPPPGPMRERLRQRLGAPDRPAIRPPLPRETPPAPPQAPAPLSAHPALAKLCKDLSGLVGLCLLIGIIFNILLAIWIFTDIRKRGEGSGVFIALALLAGIPTAIIYSLVRLGDKKP